jgi:hypothetical protein
VLFDAADEDPAVLALEKVERLDRLLPEPRRDQAHVRVELVGQLEDRGEALLHGDFDELALTGGERS